jgi:plasmid stability protein
MRRTLIQFDEGVYRRLRQEAFRQERSISSLVREMVERALAGRDSRPGKSRLDQFLSVGAGRSKQQRLIPVSEKHDQALAAAFEK